jgi:hypothetical protein
MTDFASGMSGVRFVVAALSRQGRTMSVLAIVAIGWGGLNAAIFATLMVRRPAPALRARMFGWVVGGASRGRAKPRRQSQHSPA